MGLDGFGTRTLNTWAGSLCTIGLFTLLLLYTGQKMNIVVTRTGQTMMQTVKDNFFDELETFGREQDFAIAFGLINDDFNLPPLSKEIGSLDIYAYEWGFEEDGEHYYREVRLDTHICSEEELNLKGNSSIFFPIKESNVEEI